MSFIIDLFKTSFQANGAWYGDPTVSHRDRRPSRQRKRIISNYLAAAFGTSTMEFAPLFTLQVGVKGLAKASALTRENTPAVTSLCFLRDSAEATSAEEAPFVSHCRQLLDQQDDIQAKLVTCHSNGDSRIWDLGLRTSIGAFAENRGSAGLAVRRTVDNRVLYQTRDGVVSLHTPDDGALLHAVETRACTFCTVAPCKSTRAAAMVMEDTTMAAVFDFRAEQQSHSIRTNDESTSGVQDMITSLTLDGYKLYTGHDSGCVRLFDLRLSKRAVETNLYQHPVLSMDVSGSKLLCGTAGDESHATTLHLLNDELKLKKSLDTNPKKPGTSIAQWYNNKTWAAGGWDYRLRIGSGTQLVALGKCQATISTLDWYNDSVLATGTAQGTIDVWKLQRKSKKDG